MEGVDGHSTARLSWGPRPSQPLTPATGQVPQRPAPASGLRWVSLGHPQPAGHCPALLTASPRLPSGKGGPRLSFPSRIWLPPCPLSSDSSPQCCHHPTSRNHVLTVGPGDMGLLGRGVAETLGGQERDSSAGVIKEPRRTPGAPTAPERASASQPGRSAPAGFPGCTVSPSLPSSFLSRSLRSLWVPEGGACPAALGLPSECGTHPRLQGSEGGAEVQAQLLGQASGRGVPAGRP